MAMPTLEQKWDVERGVVGESADRPYLVTDAADESEARTFAQANVPTTLYGTLTLRRLELVERVGLTQWEFLARYERPTYIWYGSSPPDARFAFDTSGGTQHITQSLATVGKYGPKASEELKGAIGYDGKNVQGVDITVPVYNFTETHFFAEDDIDDAYKIACMELTGKTNAAVFRGFAAGEVLFLGEEKPLL